MCTNDHKQLKSFVLGRGDHVRQSHRCGTGNCARAACRHTCPVNATEGQVRCSFSWLVGLRVKNTYSLSSCQNVIMRHLDFFEKCPKLFPGCPVPLSHKSRKEKLLLRSSSLQLLNSFNSVSCLTYEFSLLQALLLEQDYGSKMQPNVSGRQFNVLLYCTVVARVPTANKASRCDLSCFCPRIKTLQVHAANLRIWMFLILFVTVFQCQCLNRSLDAQT